MDPPPTLIPKSRRSGPIQAPGLQPMSWFMPYGVVLGGLVVNMLDYQWGVPIVNLAMMSTPTIQSRWEDDLGREDLLHPHMPRLRNEVAKTTGCLRS